MAWVSRTTRDQNRIGNPRSTTNARIGPGAYDSSSPSRRSANFAPFASTVPRNKHEKNLVTPGPGSYARQPQGPIAESSDSYKSKTQRFAARVSRDATPGPGEYTKPGAFKPPRTYGRSKSQPGAASDPSVKWVRMPTAPSIPAPQQSYGYEEGPNGELIMQQPINVGHTGHKKDAVGPGDYEPRPIKSKQGIDFSRSLPRRAVETTGSVAQSVPGPGTYHSETKPRQFMPRKGTAVFSSQVNREERRRAKREARMPGPGSYTVGGTFGNVKREANLQFFGSTAQRFDDDKPNEVMGPGPGSYADPQSAFINAGPPRASSLQPPNAGKVGFKSTTSRFRPTDQGPGMTGPGSYEAPTMAQDVDKKLVSRTGVFGSTTRRFNFQENDAAPGPGSYLKPESDREPSRRPRMAPQRSAVFASATSRHAMPAGTGVGGHATDAGAGLPASSKPPAPPVGSYDVAPSWQTPGRGTLHSGAPRFYKSKATLAHVGPGSYNIDKTSLKRPNPNRKMIMQTMAPRFGEGKQLVSVPGPGSYDSEFTYSHMIKPTFNMSIAEGSRV